MTKTMVWDNKQNKMINVSQKSRDTLKVALDVEQYTTLKRYALEDGFDLAGISYETEKDKAGNTKKNTDGTVIFKLDKDGNRVSHVVAESTGKTNNAIAQYVKIAVSALIAVREARP